MPWTTRTPPAHGEARAQMPKRVGKTNKLRGRPRKKDVPRDQAERTWAWFHRQSRRVVGRWERLAAGFIAWLARALIHRWVQRFIMG
jgi:hypothetical protein